MGLFDGLLSKKSEPVLGIDISSSAVKVLELGRRGSGYTVEAMAVEGLPATAVVEKQIAEPEAVTDAIAKAVSRSGTKLKRAAVAVAGSSVITKNILMPAGYKDAELEDQIKAEADQYIPYSIEDVNIDFQVLGPAEDAEGQVEVLLAACRRDTVDDRASVVTNAGIDPWVIDIEAFVLENACTLLRHQMPNEGRDHAIAVVDIGSSATSMLVINNGEVEYTRDQQFGGRQLTEDIMRHYGMTWEEAGKAKRFGNLPEDYDAAVLSPFIEDVAQQIDRGLQFYFASSNQASQIDQILLGGGCAAIEGIDARVRERLQIPTEIARPFKGMNVTGRAKPQQVQRDETAMLLACGLAMRAFDPPAA